MTDFTNLFSPYDLKKKTYNFIIFQKINECNSIKVIDKTNSSPEQTKFQLSEII